jgi:uncharacterized protein (TIGR03437 family)
MDAGASSTWLEGTAKSSDLPGLWSTPVTSRPKPGQQPSAGFVARLSSDGVKLSPTELLPVAVNNPNSNVLAMRKDGSAIIVPQLAAVTLSDPPRVASITDTDNTRLVRVAPGQLLTLWGTKLSPSQDSQPSASSPISFNGITVTFNGIAAPILYASGDQVNLQVPFEVAGRNEVTMQVTGQLGDPPFSESFILGVIARQPSLPISGANFAGPLFGVSGCAPSVRCIQPLAINEDGTANGSDHPAPSGSTITVFLNAIGITSPALATGSISTSLTDLTPGVTIPCCYDLPIQVLATETIPQSSTTVAQVRILVSSSSSPVSVPLAIQDSLTTAIRGVSVLIWTIAEN